MAARSNFAYCFYALRQAQSTALQFGENGIVKISEKQNKTKKKQVGLDLDR